MVGKSDKKLFCLPRLSANFVKAKNVFLLYRLATQHMLSLLLLLCGVNTMSACDRKRQTERERTKGWSRRQRESAKKT